MTLPAPAAATATHPGLPAVAATPCLPALTGPPAGGRLLGSSRCAVWVSTGGDVIVVSAADGVRLPNGVALGVASAEGPFARLGPGDPAAVGGGRIALPGLVVRAVRWWDPRPVLPSSDPGRVWSRIGALRRRIGRLDDAGLGAALASGDAPGAAGAAIGLLGRGSGLTPQGDDVVAGALAAHLLVGEALGRPDTAATVGRTAGDVLAAAADRTTALSASLLRHACRGEVAGPVARFLEALVGRGHGETAAGELLAVGHSSGAALAAGVLAGAEAACRRARP